MKEKIIRCVALGTHIAETGVIYRLSNVKHIAWRWQVAKDYDDLALLLEYLEKQKSKEEKGI